MRSTRKNQRKAIKALALGFATAAIFATTASAGVGTDITPGHYSSDLEAEMAMIQAPSFSAITSPAELYAGQLEPGSSTQAQPTSEIPYLSWGATADDLGPFKASVANRSSVTGIPDGDNYVANLVQSAGVSGASAGVSGARAGVTPTNLARAYNPIEQGVAQPDGFQPQLQGDQQVIIRDKPDGFQPQTKTVGRLTVSASSDGLDRGDLALGFGLGLILATACAIALAMTRDRQQTRMAHS
ncbi:MAG TPA: hypothetical protein VFP31_03530 [Gaiellaceae bacterium]|nr:hypothetical protein [Gaiellaceae bacterium]